MHGINNPNNKDGNNYRREDFFAPNQSGSLNTLLYANNGAYAEQRMI